jgi:hypothetical protein
MPLASGPGIAETHPAGIARKPDVDQGNPGNIIAWWVKRFVSQPYPPVNEIASQKTKAFVNAHKRPTGS